MSNTIEISYKGETKRVPRTYLPKSLNDKDRKAQIKSIFLETERPETKFKTKRSGWVKKFEEKYKHKITDEDFINDNLLKKAGQKQVISKGMGAYYSSGSRPNQSAYSWGYGRLASVLLGGPSRVIDRKIYNKYKVKK